MYSQLPRVCARSFDDDDLPSPLSPPPDPPRYAHSPMCDPDDPPPYPPHYPLTAAPKYDLRRMSEPALFAGPSAPFPTPHPAPPPFPYPRYAPYAPALHRGASTGDLRARPHRYAPPASPPPAWAPHPDAYAPAPFDPPLSPHRPNFSGAPASPAGPYPPHDDAYGPSPPGTGTSTSSLPRKIPHTRGSDAGLSPTDPATGKTYSFVSLPGNAVKKRPRRRYDEIERLYQCSYPNCTKAYGTLNHLNAHVTMQKHGSKRSPNEFKELRKLWRKSRKDHEAETSRPGGPVRHENFGAHDVHPYDAPAHLRRTRSRSPDPLPLPAYHSTHQHSHRTHAAALGLPTSVAVAHAGGATRFELPIEDIRYPPPDRAPAHDYSIAPRRYPEAASWPAPAAAVPRASLHHHHVAYAQPAPRAHAHPALSVHIPGTPQHALPGIVMDRLPPDSTLLTPLPGYTPPPMLPMPDGLELAYPQGYYEDEHAQRPGTGHGSHGGSGDDY